MGAWAEGPLDNDDALDAVGDFYYGLRAALNKEGKAWKRASIDYRKSSAAHRYLGLLYVALEQHVSISCAEAKRAKAVIASELVRCGCWTNPKARARALGVLSRLLRAATSKGRNPLLIRRKIFKKAAL